MIDVKKCIGCRKGVSLFTKKDDKYSHLDLFFSAAAGSSRECQNSDVIGDLLEPNGDRGTFLPKEGFKEFMDAQNNWWEDIISLCVEVLETAEAINDFFNNGKNGTKNIEKENEEIENELLLLAIEKGIEVASDEYESLIKFK